MIRYMRWTYWDYEQAPADLIPIILEEMREERERQDHAP